MGATTCACCGLLVGRLGILALPGVPNARLLAASGGSAAVLIGVGATWGVQPVELYFAAIGILLGFVFPLLVALVGLQFPEARGLAVGLVIGAGSLGGFALPWLHGVVGDTWGVKLAVAGLALWSGVLGAAAWTARRN